MPGFSLIFKYWIIGCLPILTVFPSFNAHASNEDGVVVFDKSIDEDGYPSASAQPSSSNRVSSAESNLSEKSHFSSGEPQVIYPSEAPATPARQGEIDANSQKPSIKSIDNQAPAAVAAAHSKRLKSATPLIHEFITSTDDETWQPMAHLVPDNLIKERSHPAPLLAVTEAIAATPTEATDTELGVVQVGAEGEAIAQTPADPADPDLGVVQIGEEEPRLDSELGTIQLRNPLQDPELGIIQLSPIQPPPPRRPFLYISTYLSASSSDNVFLVESPVLGRIGDNFIRPGISVLAFPSIGPRTSLLASVEANFVRYEQQSNSSYDELRFRAGVRHSFTNRVYGQLSFTNQLLFDEGFTEQFFTNTGIELTLARRDPLTSKLTLDTYYQGQIYFSDPSQFSNVLNSVGGYLGYGFAPRWDTGIGYRLTISDYINEDRHETYQRITGQLRYSITPNARISLFGGLSYGRSSEPTITFDDSFFGIIFDATIQVF